MKSKPSDLFSLPATPSDEFSKKAKSVAEEFQEYCREHKLLPTYELFSRWLTAPAEVGKDM
ncbi:MAG TPA: hypothetical protein VGM92_12945 [Candidatus Kapabacteria bacterium]|jgi:hypothetical protein